MKHLVFVAALALFRASAMGQEPRLVGSERDLVSAIHEAESIWLGRFTSLGQKDIGPISSFIYLGAEVEITKVLYGKTTNSVKYKARYLLRSFPPEDAELIPRLGVEYILCGRLSGGVVSVSKMLTVTSENLKLVQQLGSQVGQSPFSVPPIHIPRKYAEEDVKSHAAAVPPVDREATDGPSELPLKPKAPQDETRNRALIRVLLAVAAILGAGLFALKRIARSRKQQNSRAGRSVRNADDRKN